MEYEKAVPKVGILEVLTSELVLVTCKILKLIQILLLQEIICIVGEGQVLYGTHNEILSDAAAFRTSFSMNSSYYIDT
jgi:hypothetical protein